MQAMIQDYKLRMEEVRRVSQAYFIPFYQALIEKKVRGNRQETLKNCPETDDNSPVSLVVREIIKFRLLIGNVYMSVFPNPFVGVYAVREFLLLVDRAAASAAPSRLDASLDSKDLHFNYLIPLLEQDGFIRTIDAHEDAFQYRLTAKGATLLEIMQNFMPDITTGDHSEIAAKMASGELLDGLRRLLAHMGESALRSELEKQGDALEKWPESFK